MICRSNNVMEELAGRGVYICCNCCNLFARPAVVTQDLGVTVAVVYLSRSKDPALISASVKFCADVFIEVGGNCGFCLWEVHCVETKATLFN